MTPVAGEAFSGMLDAEFITDENEHHQDAQTEPVFPTEAEIELDVKVAKLMMNGYKIDPYVFTTLSVYILEINTPCNL
jgi:hypothetical protein